ncbi:hypothetical protein BJX66DRAFT_292744 [Aspergillus keveii]|uniref:Uncharacterized protein n=1 Tax=Aspergillus keveii TaxID=714993 RepID=A0ABR4GLD8_9EURO
MFVKLGALKRLPANFTRLLDPPDDEILRRMRAARDRLATFAWKGPQSKEAKRVRPPIYHSFVHYILLHRDNISISVSALAKDSFESTRIVRGCERASIALPV